ncbi:streptomycin 6-kinase [Brevibacillus sp. IT-7CA2]
MISLPTHFSQTIMGVHKEEGRLWLDSFHELIADCEVRWSLKVLEPFPLSYNFVAPVVFQDGRNAVLKLGVPGQDWQRELAAIRAFAGRGMVQLLDADEEKGIMLLERIMPGETLDKLSSEDERIQCLADVIKRMHTPVSRVGKLASTFPTIADWAVGLEKIRPHFQGGQDRFPSKWWSGPCNGTKSFSPHKKNSACCMVIFIMKIFCAQRESRGWQLIQRG